MAVFVSAGGFCNGRHDRSFSVGVRLTEGHFATIFISEHEHRDSPLEVTAPRSKPVLRWWPVVFVLVQYFIELVNMGQLPSRLGVILSAHTKPSCYLTLPL